VDDLAASMVDAQGAAPGRVPAGYTYLAQFIIHDLTWLSPKGEKEQNKASAMLDMDSVLGNRFADPEPGCPGSVDALRVGLTLAGYGTDELPLPDDVPRKEADSFPTGSPLIPDTRNEAFLQLAQMHVAFLKFYNAVARKNGFGGDGFDEDAAKQNFRQHVQSVVLYDLLERLTDPVVYEDVVTGNRRRIIHPDRVTDQNPFVIPIEFAAAAARFGHTMVRESYEWNATHHEGRPADLITLVTLSHQNSYPGDARLLHLPRDWVIDWQRFFDFSPLLGATARTPVGANLISPRVAQTMGSLPEHLRVTPSGKKVPDDRATFNIARETLRRQLDFMMASAQTAIDCINCCMPEELSIEKLTPDELAGEESRTSTVFGRHPELAGMTPIWFYVLREAELKGGGERLGPFGSRLVAETIHAAIEATGKDSLTANSHWTPCLPFREKNFKMTDLIAYAFGLASAPA
ncbi:MAG TPA: hypothetical protein VK968_07850, partial [Roseimicrobium sp.]|nr:hypothetical protein [Roseimicrobium sp.]